MSMIDVSERALKLAIKGDLEMTAAEMGWLDDSQLRILIRGARMLLAAAERELIGRQP